MINIHWFEGSWRFWWVILVTWLLTLVSRLVFVVNLRVINTLANLSFINPQKPQRCVFRYTKSIAEPAHAVRQRHARSRTRAPLMLVASMWIENGSVAMLTIKRSASVTPQVNLRNPLHAHNEAHKRGDPLWLLNPTLTSPEIQSRSISGPAKNIDVLQTFFLKNTKSVE